MRPGSLVVAFVVLVALGVAACAAPGAATTDPGTASGRALDAAGPAPGAGADAAPGAPGPAALGGAGPDGAAPNFTLKARAF